MTNKNKRWGRTYKSMIMKIKYSWERLWAIVTKEFIQIKRDRATFAMIVGIPLMQVILFGYAINSDPKHLPTAVLTADYSNFTRSFIQGLENTGYFHVTQLPKSEQQADKMLATNVVQFVSKCLNVRTGNGPSR